MKVIFVAQSIVDVLVQVTDSRIATSGFRKSSWNPISDASFDAWLERLKDHPTTLTSGGTCPNTAVTMARLGVPTTLISAVGADKFGNLFVEECERSGLESRIERVQGTPTARSLILVTPDGERTMLTAQGIAGQQHARALPAHPFEASDLVVLDGFLIGDGKGNISSLAMQVRDQVRSCGAKLALALGNHKVVTANREAFRELLPDTSVLIGDTDEGAALLGCAPELADRSGFPIKTAVFTKGRLGALVINSGKVTQVPAFPVNAIDTTGAGDSFAAGFLAGLAFGSSAEAACRRAAFLASRKVLTRGPRLGEEARQIWEESSRA